MATATLLQSSDEWVTYRMDPPMDDEFAIIKVAASSDSNIFAIADENGRTIDFVTTSNFPRFGFERSHVGIVRHMGYEIVGQMGKVALLPPY